MSPRPSLVHRLARGMRWRAVERIRRSDRYRRKTIADYLQQNRPAKLHIGCGENILSGWLNTEFEILIPRGVIYLDASKPFPIGDAQFDFIFSEHMVEHIDLPAARLMLQECHRVLKPGGRIRIGTPRLEFLAELLLTPGDEHRRYADYHFESEPDSCDLQTPGAVLNDYFHLWGHRFVYDEASFRRLLQDAGFVDVAPQASGESSVRELRGLEHEARMPDGLLALTTMTFEGVKPG